MRGIQLCFATNTIVRAHLNEIEWGTRLVKIGTPKEVFKGENRVAMTPDSALQLQKLGYDVLIANSGKQSIDIIKNKSKAIHMVILDMIMPDMDGGKTFDMIRNIDPTMPILLSSGYAMDNQTEAILKRGCNGFIQKPFNLSELSRKVRSILDGDPST